MSTKADQAHYQTDEQTVVVSETATTTKNFSLQGAQAGSVQYAYDDLERLIQVTDPSGRSAIYHYDAVGNVTSIERPGATGVAISGFVPASGAVGKAVTIYGAGFSTTPSSNTVLFNGTNATVTSATATQIVATVPPGASTGAIGVTAPTGSATSAQAFTVVPPGAGPPTITSFSPPIVLPAASVMISGTNFETLPANDRVTVNGVLAEVTAASPTSLTVTVPASVGSGPISLITPAGMVVTAADLFIPPAPYTVADVDFTARVLLGASQAVTINASNHIGIITFAVSSGQRVSLQITGGTLPAYYRLYRPDNSEMSSNYWAGGAGGFIDTKTLVVSGTYTWVVISAGTGTTTLKLNDVPPDWTGSITPGGTAVTVTTTAPGQNARLTFGASANQRVSTEITAGTLSAYYKVLTPDGAELSASYWSGGSGGFFEPILLPVAGTYTLLVDGSWDLIGTTTVKLNDVPPDATGTITADGQPVTVTTSTPGQNAGLTFTGAANQRVSISITNTSLRAYYQILKPDGSQFSSDYRGAGGFIDTKTLPTSGTYTLKVDGFYADYGSATVYLYTVVDLTGSISVGGATQAVSITTPGQGATYTMDAVANQTVTVRIANNTMGYVTVTLKKPDGTTQTSSGTSATSFNLATQTLTVGGTYAIVVDPYDANTGSLSLSVTSP